ncbi:hypothetical protein DSO57_1006101 [Entomophthora muscae]|uniref:Uncharacterized protein n=1 Tax=Entomophthora muscae TaxID=34485 RepID=A0ACC2TIZ6_9FUNG|nr:hypothetical protein DSO57_1006101 [Entomophthora muscae]
MNEVVLEPKDETGTNQEDRTENHEQYLTGTLGEDHTPIFLTPGGEQQERTRRALSPATTSDWEVVTNQARKQGNQPGKNNSYQPAESKNHQSTESRNHSPAENSETHPPGKTSGLQPERTSNQGGQPGESNPGGQEEVSKELLRNNSELLHSKDALHNNGLLCSASTQQSNPLVGSRSNCCVASLRNNLTTAARKADEEVQNPQADNPGRKEQKNQNKQEETRQQKPTRWKEENQN